MARPAAGKRVGHWPLVLVALLGLGFLAGCSGTDPYSPDGPSGARTEEQHLLDLRARAIRNHDEALFMKGLGRGDKAFRARERRYFENMVQLPLAKFRYRVLASTWPRRLADASRGANLQIPRVRQVTQLDGYDSGPVRRTTGFVFARQDGQLKIVADRTVTGAQFPGYQPAPWDLIKVEVRQSEDILGVFGPNTVDDAPQVLAAVADGVEEVRQGLPFSWPGHVVVYFFHNHAVLNAFTDVPGGNIRHLGALSFPVYSEPGHSGTDGKPRTVGMRFALLPSSLRAGQPFLGRIVRHELTHVALGARDDGAPVWFAEGLAEYMGARPLPRSQRRIASVALTRARQPVDGMPASAGFNGPDQDWHYALSWMACDYIAATHGESTLWELMEAFHNGGAGTSDQRQDAALERIIGIGNHELAQRAAARILQLYG